ncbi:MAG: hypothetical protein KDD67_04650 [Ignavibacteriae bacterium]|nr:hypothetical protein [Ignavibacteriota bacterium]MCB9216380.1 hypothetical protein [Ignavibacteria bacterium]
MQDLEFAQRIIETADEYHFTAEEQWRLAIELEPTDEASLFEFKRIVRAALLFYARAYLILDMVETDEDQSLEDILEIIAESREDIRDFFQSNNVFESLDEEGSAEFSRIFSVAEAVRSILLENSNHLATTLHSRFLQKG